MGMNIKSFQQVLKGMVDWTAQNSTRLIDFSPGSVIRTLYEAVATELEELYVRIYKNFRWAVENSVYESFSFTKQPAMAAYGDLRITFSSALPSSLVIPAGVRFAAVLNDGTQLQYETKEEFTVQAGATEATITVHCTVPGAIGNVAAGAISQMLNPIAYVSSVGNPQRFLTGKDEESDAERKARFAKYVQTRSRGTKAALEYGALEVPGVVGVYVNDAQAGIVKLYAHDANGDLPEPLKSAVIANLENYRPAGIPVIVQPSVKLLQNVSVTITVDPLYNSGTFVQYLQDNISSYLNSFSSGKDLFLSDLNAFIRNLEPVGIKNCVISAPASDVNVEPYQLIRAGTVTVNVQEG